MKTRISRLGAVLLAVALLLPCMLTVPAQAQGAEDDILSIADHAQGEALTKEALSAYLNADGAYILPTGTYCLAEDMTLDKQFVVDDGQDVVLCLNGHTLTSTYINTENTTDGLFRVIGGTLTIEDSAEGTGVIDGSNTYKCLYVSDGGNVVLQGGTITNFNSDNGGAIRLGKNGTFTMEGGKITNNKAAKYGGAIHPGTNGIVVINGGTISGNEAPNGAVIYFQASTSAQFIVNGGIIEKNNTTTSANKDIRLGNASDKNADAFVSVNGGYVDASFFGTNISITGGTFTNDPTKWLSDGYAATQDENGLWEVFRPTSEIHLQGTQLTADLLAGCVNEDGVSVLPGGTYYLADDLTVANNISVDEATTLCLNGKTLKVDSAVTGNLFVINDNGSLTVCGGSDGDGCMDGTGATSIRAIHVDGGKLVLNSGTLKNFNNFIVVVASSGSFTMTGGKLTGGSTSSTGGALRMYKGTFTMNGGEISGNTGKYGPAIYSSSACTVNINDGAVIKDNRSTSLGGAVYLSSDSTGTINFNGGEISGNSSASNGGAIAVASGKVNIKGGTFSGNEANYGGVLALSGAGTYNITGGTFKANTVNKDGGVVYASSAATGTISISGGTFLANHANAYGGVMRIGSTNVTLNVTGGVYVNNTATSSNQTIYTNTDSTISGVTIVTDGVPTNPKCLISGGKFNQDPSSRLATDIACYVRDIDQTITVDGVSYDLTHEIVSGFTEMGGHVNFGSSMNAAILLNDADISANDYTLTVTQNKWNANGGTDSITLDASIERLDLGDGITSLALVANGIAAKEMRDELTYVVTDAEGNELFRKTSSLYDMFKQWYDESDDDFYRTMIADLVNYGAAAMTEFGYGQLTDQPLPGSQTDPVWLPTEGAGASAGYENKVAFTISLKDKIVLNVYVSGVVTGLTDVTMDGQNYDKYTLEPVEGSTDVTRIVFDKINVVDAKKPITFTVALEGGETFNVTYSIKDYVVAALNGSQSGVVKALQKYVESVSAYITESTREPDMKILFIGNSATYYTDIPGDLTRLAKKNGFKLQCDHVTQGSATLVMFADGSKDPGKKALNAIAQGYDLVFIQDNGSCIADDDAKLASTQAAQTLSDAIKASGAKVGIYIRPPYYKDSYGYTALQQCEEFDKHFLAMADTVDADVISYVNRAFAVAMEETDYFLWIGGTKENQHMNDYGGYLAACVFYTTLCNDSATKLGTDGLPEADALVLQQIADRIVLNGENPFNS